jgi:hypothetical protein
MLEQSYRLLALNTNAVPNFLKIFHSFRYQKAGGRMLHPSRSVTVVTACSKSITDVRSSSVIMSIYVISCCFDVHELSVIPSECTYLKTLSVSIRKQGLAISHEVILHPRQLAGFASKLHRVGFVVDKLFSLH